MIRFSQVFTDFTAVLAATMAVTMAVIPTSRAWSDDGEGGDPADAERQLIEVRGEISDLEEQIRDRVSARGKAESSLSEAERGEAKVRGRLEEIEASLTTTRQQLAGLEAEADVAQTALAGRISELERQLRIAFVAGRDDWLRSVLSQRDPVAVGRQLVYHSYIAEHRSTVIAGVQRDLEQLVEVRSRVDAESQHLQQLEADERDHLVDLSGARERRKVALAQINTGIATSNERIDRLRNEAAELEALVAELTRILTNLPVTGAVPFAERKGQMEWPTSGRIVRKFGESRADGRLRWDGVIMSAPAGSDVRAIHHGRVVFSDWLPGMGLLVILEHGDGYLSLYGHNQDLMTEVGEWVDPGTVIAHVGDSGGQAANGLYFEIRKAGAPQNPARWVAR